MRLINPLRHDYSSTARFGKPPATARRESCVGGGPERQGELPGMRQAGAGDLAGDPDCAMVSKAVIPARLTPLAGDLAKSGARTPD